MQIVDSPHSQTVPTKASRCLGSVPALLSAFLFACSSAAASADCGKPKGVIARSPEAIVIKQRQPKDAENEFRYFGCYLETGKRTELVDGLAVGDTTPGSRIALAGKFASYKSDEYGSDSAQTFVTVWNLKTGRETFRYLPIDQETKRVVVSTTGISVFLATTYSKPGLTLLALEFTRGHSDQDSSDGELRQVATGNIDPKSVSAVRNTVKWRTIGSSTAQSSSYSQAKVVNDAT